MVTPLQISRSFLFIEEEEKTVEEHEMVQNENYFLCLLSGDGTMLLVASKVCDKNKPVLGVNTDPERLEM